MNIDVRKFDDSMYEVWNKFLSNQPRNADFMMSQTFLSYHKDRFIDQSLIVYINGEIGAIFPAASIPKNERVVMSHPGASYGGLAYLHKYGGSSLVDIGAAIISYYKSVSFQTLFVKTKPPIYSDPSGSEDLYVWWRNGGVIERVDISNVI